MAIEKFAREMNKTSEGRNTLQKIFDAISNFLKKMKEVFRGDVARVHSEAFASLNFEQNFKEVVAQLEEAEALWKELAKAAVTGETVQTKNTTETDGVRYSAKEEVLKWDINWDSNNFSSLKEQLIANLDVVNKMPVVAEVKFTPTDGKNVADQLRNILKTKFGDNIETQYYGNIFYGKSSIKDVMDYITNDGEAAAILASPYVIKRGKPISGHRNHKNKGFPSVTFAGPCRLNGEIANVAVAVQYGQKGAVHSVKVLTPTGKVFELTKSAETTSVGNTKNGAMSTIISADNFKISQPNNSVNTQDDGLRNSEKDTDYLAAVKRGDMETAQRMVDEADQYFTSSVLLHNPPSSIKGKIFLCQFILKDEEKVQPIGRTFSFLF